MAGYYTVDRAVIRPETDKTKSFSPLTCLHYLTYHIHRQSVIVSDNANRKMVKQQSYLKKKEKNNRF